jgi:hypothetical protein
MYLTQACSPKSTSRRTVCAEEWNVNFESYVGTSQSLRSAFLSLYTRQGT